MEATRATPALGLFPPVVKTAARVLQVNLGRLCNQACRHCHVDASPKHDGPDDNASDAVCDALLELLRREPSLRVFDLTGGAPELHPRFRGLVEAARGLGREVFVRHNLTVQDEPEQADLPEWFAARGVALYCSLPCYLEDNVDAQRGRGVYDRSIAALRRLNAAGFGVPGRGLELHLVYNPLGPSLPPPQAALEADYKRELRARFGIVFDRLLTITNQPIHRFREDLERGGRLPGYMDLLRASFNAETLPALMCRDTVSVRWDGALFDCDFNLVQSLPLRGADRRPRTVHDLLREGAASLEGLPIAVDQHCFACTAGAGSSCGGALSA